MIEAPCIIKGMGIRDYHAAPGISKSGLDDIAKCPQIYKALRSPEAPTRYETPAQLHGNLAHCALLEPDAFDKRYVVLPEDAPRRPTAVQRNAKKPSDDTRAAVAWWDEFNERTKGAKTITAEQRATALAQAASMRALKNVFHDLGMEQLLKRGVPEVSAFWNDPDTGVLCRCRPDLAVDFDTGESVLPDVKTFNDATPEQFARQVARMRYYVQDAYYSDGYGYASGRRVVAFPFIVVEDSYPYAAASYNLGDESKAQGYNEYRYLLDVYARCLKSGEWPGYADRTQTIEMPAYALTPAEVEISYAS